MKVLQILAFPLSILYSLVIRLRNFLYDRGILHAKKFNIPVISIGNLSIGGTGKSPHIEYLIELLGVDNIATLSRGYGRRTTGFFLVNENSTIDEVGDEPLQFKKKYKQILVAVCEDRIKGINELLQINPQLKTILLDDAFQHRSVKPGLSILLTDYSKPFYKDFMLPAGTLREPRSGAKRADLIIVTKAPDRLTDGERESIIQKIKPLPHQQIYFSKIMYGGLKPIEAIHTGEHEILKEFSFDASYSIVLFTGIANPDSLLKHLQSRAKEVRHIRFPDHHQFLQSDIEKVVDEFNNISNPNKIIITTEKDAMRLNDSSIKKLIGQQQIFIIPIKIYFKEIDHANFNNQIKEYVEQNN